VAQRLRLLLRPFGYIAFLVSLLALSASARLLGQKHELGFFAGRLARTVWCYPEVTRRSVQFAWLLWTALLAAALSPLDPLASRWDEFALASVALLVLLHRFAAGQRGGH
jgi:hypothetical protein